MTVISTNGLLYPKGAGTSSSQKSEFLGLSSAAMHDLGLDEIIAATTSEREHQKEIRVLPNADPAR